MPNMLDLHSLSSFLVLIEAGSRFLDRGNGPISLFLILKNCTELVVNRLATQ